MVDLAFPRALEKGFSRWWGVTDGNIWGQPPTFSGMNLKSWAPSDWHGQTLSGDYEFEMGVMSVWVQSGKQKPLTISRIKEVSNSALWHNCKFTHSDKILEIFYPLHAKLWNSIDNQDFDQSRYMTLASPQRSLSHSQTCLLFAPISLLNS